MPSAGAPVRRGQGQLVRRGKALVRRRSTQVRRSSTPLRTGAWFTTETRRHGGVNFRFTRGGFSV